VFKIEILNNDLEKLKLQRNTEKDSVNKEKELEETLAQLTSTPKEKDFLRKK
jgi:hypothetical protein